MPRKRLPLPGLPVGQIPGKDRANALRALQQALGTRPSAFSPEEWAVVHATLDPDRPCHYSARRAPWVQYVLIQRARACFPGLNSLEALRAFSAALKAPHVAELISMFRNIELLDVMEHRSIVRRSFHTVLALQRFLEVDKDVSEDRKGAAALAKEVLAAGRALMDLDDLRATSDAISVKSTAEAAPDDLTAVESVLADLQARKGPP